MSDHLPQLMPRPGPQKVGPRTILNPSQPLARTVVAYDGELRAAEVLLVLGITDDPNSNASTVDLRLKHEVRDVGAQ